MPITVGGAEQLPQKQSVRVPALNDPFTTKEEMPIRATFSREIPNNSPAVISGFEDLPPEEQERIKGRYRFMGIRLRHDLSFDAVPISKQTMDI